MASLPERNLSDQHHDTGVRTYVVPPTDGTLPDPFDPQLLRLSQDYASAVGAKKALLTIPVCKPKKEWFVRVHPDESYRVQTAVIELKEDREVYLVAPELRPSLSAESTFGPRLLLTAITAQGSVFIWPIRLPGPNGKLDSWNASALEAAEIAKNHWVRVVSNMQAGGYDVIKATGDIPDPTWPAGPFADLLRVAFKGRYIDSLDNPVLRRLRGEA
jgi:hypothetical protein